MAEPRMRPCLCRRGAATFVFFFVVVKDTSTAKSRASDMILNEKLVWVWKGTVEACFKILLNVYFETAKKFPRLTGLTGEESIHKIKGI